MTAEELEALIKAWFLEEGEKPGKGYVTDQFGDDLTIDGDFDIGALVAHILQHQQIGSAK